MRQEVRPNIVVLLTQRGGLGSQDAEALVADSLGRHVRKF